MSIFIRGLFLLWMFFGTAFSGFRDERIWEAFEPADGETYVENMVRGIAAKPELVRFLLEYPVCCGNDFEIDITKEVYQGGIPLFLQMDGRWGYRTYGTGFLAMTGCGPTCLSMVYCGLTGDTEWNPYAVARMAQKKGYYVDGVGTSWDLMTSGARSLGLNVWQPSIDSGEIVGTLQQGCPLIASMRPGDFTRRGHFIVLRGIDWDGRIIVNDPNSTANSERTWEVDRLVSQMKGLWAYSY